jgi:protein-S-isoprenylcysteine O-methyltransferase Ste14
VSHRLPAPGGGTPRSIGVALRNLLFTLIVPGAGGVYVPWLILTRHGASPTPEAWYAVPVIAAGLLLYSSCVWLFATVGRGTPATWDPPRQFVAVGPYRWVRNPIYLAAMLIVGGEAWLFLSTDLLLYTCALAVGFHLIVVSYEEPKLRTRFGKQYQTYCRTVSRWIPHPPARRTSREGGRERGESAARADR